MDFNKIGLTVDRQFNPFSMSREEVRVGQYGRGLERASGLALWLIAATMLLGGGYGFSTETLDINNLLLAWMGFILGACQLYYNEHAQRTVFNLMATAVWVTISIAAYQELGGWNLITAISLPYCLCTFYSYGFLLGIEEMQDDG